LESWQKTQRIYHTAEKRIENLNKPLLFEPGSKFKYSNLGYKILAVIIERCSGKSYTEFLNQRFFKPFWGKGQITIHQTTIRYYFLAGDVNGYRAYMVINVEHDICIIILSNIDITPVESIANQLTRLVLGDAFQLIQPQYKQADIEFSFAPQGVYRSTLNNDNSILANREYQDKKLLSQLGSASIGDIANGIFLRYFEQFNINPSGTFFVLETRKKHYLFIQVRFSWVMFELILVDATEDKIEFITRYYDGKLELSFDDNCVSGVFTHPQGSRMEAVNIRA
jgi:hypothetical protein